MKSTTSRLARTRSVGAAIGAVAVLAAIGDPRSRVTAQAAQSAQAEAPVPNLAGVWDGTPRAHPVNSETMPWARTMAAGRTLPDGTKADANYVSNFPVLNERGLAFQKIFDEPLSPKYDCQPATPPAIEFDPYYMEIVQWPDRVLLR